MTFIPTTKIVNGRTYYKVIYDDLKYEYWISEDYSVIYDKPLKNGIKSCEIKPWFNINIGYYTFNLSKIVTSQIRFIYHRALYESFYGLIGNLQVDHINSDKLNNALSNLQAISQAENIRKGSNTKIDAVTALAVYQTYIANNLSIREISLQFGVPQPTIYGIIRGTSWIDITKATKHQRVNSKLCNQNQRRKRKEQNRAIKLAKGL